MNSRDWDYSEGWEVGVNCGLELFRKFIQIGSATWKRLIPRLFLRPKFLRPIPRLIWDQNFWDLNFWDRYRDFFSRPNIFVTDTEIFFRDRDQYSQKIEKSLDTEKSRDEMSHSACCSLYVSSYLLCQEQSTLWSVVPSLVMIGVWPSYEILFDDIAPCLYLSGYMCFCQTFDI